MITIRKSKDRGHFNFGWLDTYHSFSFGDYHDTNHMGFRTLRVINEDVVQPGQGFPLHGHRDMEIVTYILKGELEHRDSLGNRETIKRGELQSMTAGTGIRHSEYNASDKEPCHLLQIWILPEKKDLPPCYAQKPFPNPSTPPGCAVTAHTPGVYLGLVVSPKGEDGSLTIHQDVKLFIGRFKNGGEKDVLPAKGRHAWIQITKGSVLLNEYTLEAGDGVAISNKDGFHLSAISDCEFLLFDLN